jgi:hypothetical protein
VPLLHFCQRAIADHARTKPSRVVGRTTDAGSPQAVPLGSPPVTWLVPADGGEAYPRGAAAIGPGRTRRRLVLRQATFARSESSLADAITRCSVNSPSAYRHVMRSPEREGEGMCQQISRRPVSLPDPVYRLG